MSGKICFEQNIDRFQNNRKNEKVEKTYKTHPTKNLFELSFDFYAMEMLFPGPKLLLPLSRRLLVHKTNFDSTPH